MKAVLDAGKLRKNLRRFYNSSDAYAEHLSEEDEAYFQRYLSLVSRYAASAHRVLDAGCGTGFSSHLLSRQKKEVIGIDISELFLKRGSAIYASPNLAFACADILSLPFKNGSFDLVASYLVIEFFPEVERGLEEMCRVLKKGGVLLIVAPNLLSPTWPLKDYFRMVQGGAARPVWCEDRRNALQTFKSNLKSSLKKMMQRDPEFLYREPDLTCRKVIGRDSDSVYLASPMDLEKFLRKRGFRILRTGSESNWIERVFPFLSVSVEIVAQK
ncbi:MAG TPA: class I SAM-dependent methyltransferase [bacterium]|nr:class I SAM-dependent methyltransferase [bacterium]